MLSGGVGGREEGREREGYNRREEGDGRRMDWGGGGNETPASCPRASSLVVDGDGDGWMDEWCGNTE